MDGKNQQVEVGKVAKDLAVIARRITGEQKKIDI